MLYTVETAITEIFTKGTIDPVHKKEGDVAQCSTSSYSAMGSNTKYC